VTIPPPATTDAAIVETPPGWLDAFLPHRDARQLAVTGIAAAGGAAVLCSATPVLVLWPALIGFALFAALIAAGDAVTRRIPNKLNGAAAASAIPLLALAATGWPGGSPLRAVLGGTAAFAGYTALWLVAPSAMGLGDVKLAPYLGAYLAFFGWGAWSDGLVNGLLLQGVFVVVGLVSRRLRRGQHLAHGPAMCLGAALALLAALRVG
jgi:leader peptidase (prepilin peptidase) / N-methyltransferase